MKGGVRNKGTVVLVIDRGLSEGFPLLFYTTWEG